MIIKNIGNETMRYSGIYSIILKPNEERDFPPEIGQRLLATMPNLIETGNFVYKEDNKRYLGHLSAYNTYYGYGVGGLAWVRALVKAGINMRVWDKYNGKDDLNSISETDRNLIEALTKQTFVPNNVIVHTLSSALHKFRPTTDEHIILHTMWEGATLPKGWASIINTCKALMLPSEGLRELFVNSGVTVPIGCFPYPVDLSNFTYQKPVFEDTFTFFTWGVLNQRKCPYETIDIFLRTFPRNKYPNVRLVMKAHLVFGNKLIGIPTVKDDRVKIYEEYWTPTRLLEELRKVQACIFLTRGEGFQIPLYEATAAGLPVIACNHTAPQDFCNLGNKWNVEVKSLEDSTHGKDDNGETIKWFEPDYEQAGEHMLDIYNNYEKAVLSAKKMNTAVRKYLNYKTIVGNFITWVDEING